MASGPLHLITYGFAVGGGDDIHSDGPTLKLLE